VSEWRLCWSLPRELHPDLKNFVRRQIEMGEEPAYTITFIFLFKIEEERQVDEDGGGHWWLDMTDKFCGIFFLLRKCGKFRRNFVSTKLNGELGVPTQFS
jgi:hypothetical protein